MSERSTTVTETFPWWYVAEKISKIPTNYLNYELLFSFRTILEELKMSHKVQVKTVYRINPISALSPKLSQILLKLLPESEL